MASKRLHFSSKLSFILAASGSAVGVGNIWNFPILVAENGGAAFVLMYLILSFLLAYPALIAELNIGRYSQTNTVSAMESLSHHQWIRKIGKITAIAGLITMILICGFYSIIGGWFISHALSSVAGWIQIEPLKQILNGFHWLNSTIATITFIILSALIVSAGVKKGIERWSLRLMPTLFILLIALIAVTLTQPGAMEGLRMYWLPDFTQILSPKLILSALGQSFFSLSLGTGCMMIYGSYLSQKTNLPKTAFMVTLVDTFIAILAGMLIIPSMYVLMQQGGNIYNQNGQLQRSDTLVFEVLPNLFHKLGMLGEVVSFAFFILLTIAALTSSISMLEPIVAAIKERINIKRATASILVAIITIAISVTIISHLNFLLGLTVRITTQIMQPILCFLIVIYGGWVIRQHHLLSTLSQGYPKLKNSLFWKWWPWYVKWVCPSLITILLIYGVFS